MLCAGIGHVGLRKVVIHGSDRRHLSTTAVVEEGQQHEQGKPRGRPSPRVVMVPYASIVSLAGGSVKVRHHFETCLQHITVAFVVLLRHVPRLDSTAQLILIQQAQGIKPQESVIRTCTAPALGGVDVGTGTSRHAAIMGAHHGRPGTPLQPADIELVIVGWAFNVVTPKAVLQGQRGSRVKQARRQRLACLSSLAVARGCVLTPTLEAVLLK